MLCFAELVLNVLKMLLRNCNELSDVTFIGGVATNLLNLIWFLIFHQNFLAILFAKNRFNHYLFGHKWYRNNPFRSLCRANSRTFISIAIRISNILNILLIDEARTRSRHARLDYDICEGLLLTLTGTVLLLINSGVFIQLR